MIESKLSECCDAPVYAYNSKWKAGYCSKCKEFNSVKEQELEEKE